MLDTGQLPLNGEALHWFRQGLAAVAEESYEAAVQYYDQVLEQRPDFYEAWYERGLALEGWGYYTQAIASFDRAIHLRPSAEVASQIWHERGNALQYGLGDYVQAIACYDHALKLNAGHAPIWQSRGNALLYGLSRPEEALMCYNRAIELNDREPLVWRNRGHALVELREYETAIASYDRALTLNPDDDVAWHARNLASERSGLVYRLPTTHRAPCDTEFEKPTFIEGETQAHVTLAADTTLTLELQSPDPLQPYLLIEDDWGRRELFLERDFYVIGRDASCDIQLRSQFVSRQHALLQRVTQGETSYYEIIDGSPTGKPSTNGLLINGKKRPRHQLQASDQVIFGPGAQITFQVGLLSAAEVPER